MKTTPAQNTIRQLIIQNTKHISPYEPTMKNVIINVDMLVGQIEDLVNETETEAYFKGISDGKGELLDGLRMLKWDK